MGRKKLQYCKRGHDQSKYKIGRNCSKCAYTRRRKWRKENHTLDNKQSLKWSRLHKDSVKNTNKTRIKFLGKSYHVGHIRIGICILCGESLLENTIFSTHLHHFVYDNNNKSKHTIEVCDGCHNKIHHRLFIKGKKVQIVD